MKEIHKGRLFASIVLLIVTAGCSTVEPWERGHLAKSQMALDPNPMQSASRGHTYSAREAASSGGSAKGGGCGCY
ncbi:MAG: DUF4266 domain-containing protein [Methylococcales bacterium]